MEQILEWEKTKSMIADILANQPPNFHKETNTSNVPKSTTLKLESKEAT
jgi:hypothetical protein